MIARELLVKLGFNIDTAKFEQFKTMTSDLKGKMSSVREAVSSSLSPDVQVAMKKISAYNEELKDLSLEERKNVLELNKLEKQAIREVAEEHRKKHRELKILEDAALQRACKNKEEYQNLIKGGKKLAKTLTLMTGATAAGFSLSLRNTLKDVQDFKTQKYHGEKTTSKFDIKQIREVDEFNRAFEGTKKIIVEIRNGFVIGLLPSITQITKRFQGWLKVNKEVIKTNLTTIIIGTSKAIISLTTALGNVVKMLGGWHRALSVIKIAIIGLGIYKFSQSLFIVSQNLKLVKTALSIGLNFKSLFSPITLIAAALTGLFLILEDFYVFSKGGKSIIGDIVGSDTWRVLEENIKMVTAPLEKLQELFVSVKNSIAEIKFPKNIWQNVKGKASSIIDKFMPEIQVGQKADSNILGQKRGRVHALTSEEWGAHSRQRLNQNVRPQVVEQKLTYNMTINVPQGVTQTQAELIAKTVRNELEKHTTYTFEQTMAAIGGT